MTEYRHKKPDVTDFECPNAGNSTTSHAYLGKKKRVENE